MKYLNNPIFMEWYNCRQQLTLIQQLEPEKYSDYFWNIWYPLDKNAVIQERLEYYRQNTTKPEYCDWYLKQEIEEVYNIPIHHKMIIPYKEI